MQIIEINASIKVLNHVAIEMLIIHSLISLTWTTQQSGTHWKITVDYKTIHWEMIEIIAAISDTVSFLGQCNKSLALEGTCVPANLFPFSFFWKSNIFFKKIYFILKHSWLTCVGFRCTEKWFIYTYTCMYSFSNYLFPFMLLQNIEKSSLWYTVASCWLSIKNSIFLEI